MKSTFFVNKIIYTSYKTKERRITQMAQTRTIDTEKRLKHLNTHHNTT